MIKALERKGFIQREPGTARSIKILVPPDEIPEWESSGSSPPTAASRARRSTRNAQVIRRAPFVPDSEEKVYVLNVALIGRRFGSRKSHKKALPREIEICGDQTLVVLHNAIFDAYDRYDEHLYEFEFGEPGVRNHLVTYGITGDEDGSARTMTLQRLRLRPGQKFGYWFDFGDSWYHVIEVKRIVAANPEVTYPRITKKEEPSPPQYPGDDDDDDDEHEES